VGRSATGDHDNTTWLSNLIATSGWPLLSEVGLEASTAAWLLAQHADDAPGLQLIFHQHMTAATKLGEASPRLLADLEDRIRINAGPQLYGTQFITDNIGALRPQPIEHPATLDERRADSRTGTIQRVRGHDAQHLGPRSQLKYVPTACNCSDYSRRDGCKETLSDTPCSPFILSNRSWLHPRGTIATPSRVVRRSRRCR
jgi:hypothetical protein